MFLSADNLQVDMEEVNIIEDCSFNVNRGEIVSILVQMVLENQLL